LKGYDRSDYDSLIVISDVKGETNFWYFFQLEDCYLINAVVEKNKKLSSIFETFVSNMDITSTYKTPYYLEERKWQDLQYRLMQSNNPVCKKISILMNKVTIAIEDENKSFLAEHPEWDLQREF
jgi:hypothetical protein